jgi:hypothetical protein
MDRQEAVIDA